MERTERVVISRSDSIGSRAAVSASVPRAVRMGVWTAPYSSMCVGRKWEFALCQNCVTYPETPGKHRDLRGRAEALRCCGKLLIGSALVGFGVRQHARADSIPDHLPRFC